MKTLSVSIVIAIILSIMTLVIAPVVDARVRVRGYYKKNGSYVQPHYRSNPDGLKYNNWSTKGNTNPYNGKYGWR